MTSYNAQTMFNSMSIQFETDNRDHYERVQQVIRECIDEDKKIPVKLFISQPMHNKSDEEIRATRKKAIYTVEKALGRKVEVIDNFFQGTEMSPLECLGESIKLLAQADIAYFASGWQLARGCVVERECAERYGVEAIVI